MTREEYEEQKRRLGEQRQALIEMTETAYQYQIRALDIVWRMLAGDGVGDLLPALPASPAPQAAAPAAPVRRLKAGELYNSIINVLAKLPDPFIFSDIYRALGHKPDRGSVHRTLQEMERDGHVATVSVGMGNKPRQYRFVRQRPAAGQR
jgi:hypothetical protein